MQTVALDYDGTVTENPQCWIAIAKVLRKFGFDVICVTSRRDTKENQDELKSVFPDWIRVIFTNHNPKKQFVERRGIKVDIWIDNDPNSLFHSDAPDKQVPDINVIVSGYGVRKPFGEKINREPPAKPMDIPFPVEQWLNELNAK